MLSHRALLSSMTATLPSTCTAKSDSAPSAVGAKPKEASNASSAYIQTDSGNRVSRAATVAGSQHIVLGGRSIIHPGCILHGDKPKAPSKSSLMIAIGKSCVLESDVQVIPSRAVSSAIVGQEISNYHYPIKIGDYTRIGRGSVVSSVSIGSYCHIDEGCHLGELSIIKDAVYLHPGTVLPPHMVIPSFSIVSGVPGRIVGHLPESYPDVRREEAFEYYEREVSVSVPR